MTTRHLPLDTLRGFIILLMALDHANSFIAHSKLQPELWADLFPSYQGHPPLTFITRLVTHLAAPGFFFLMGAGMILLAQSRRRQGWRRMANHTPFSIARSTAHLSSVHFGEFRLEPQGTAWHLFRCIVCPGRGYDYRLVAAAPAFATLGADCKWGTDHRHGTAAPGRPEQTSYSLRGSAANVVVARFQRPGVGSVSVNALAGSGGVGGTVYGRSLQQNPAQAYRRAFWLGTAALLLFIPLRYLGGFGNIRPAAGQEWIAMLNVVKYPPSITFLLLTLGTNLLLLALFSRLPDLILWPLAVFGQVPLFFYISHLFLYGFWGRWIDPAGVGIPRMIPVWLLGLLILWPLCWLYGRFKHGRPPDSLWRFF